MAEYYFNNKLESNNFKSASRGLYAEIGGTMTRNAQQVLLDNNIISDFDDISHEPTQINAQIIDEAALIYGITANHADILRANYPEYADKIHAMPENIGDPYGSGLEVYARCFEHIKSAVDIIIEELA